MANLKVNVDITNTDIFQDCIKIINDVTEDKRIGEDIRKEYEKRVKKLCRRANCGT